MKRKKHRASDLMGLVVMVNPAIKPNDDSAKSGIVVSVSPEKEMATVKFDNGDLADCNIEKLITLSPKAVIIQHLIANWEINPDDFKAALKISKLISEKKYQEALKHAANDKITQFICTMSCVAWLELKNSKNNRQGLIR